MDRLLIRAFVGKTRAQRGANDVICHDVSTKRWIVTSDCFAERRCSSHRQVSRPIHKPSKDGRCEVFPLLPTTISSLRLQRDERKLALIPNAPGMGALVYAVFENRISSQPFINHVGPCQSVEMSGRGELFSGNKRFGRLLGSEVMDFDQDRLLLAKAQLSDLLNILRVTNFDSNPVQFLMRLDAVRHTAMDHRFEAVAEIASHFEESMERVMGSGHSDMIVRNYTEILDEAIGCGSIGVEIAQSLLASVAMRLRN